MSLLRRTKFPLRKTKSYPNLQASYTNAVTSTEDALDTQSVIDAESSDEYTDTEVYSNADTDVYTNADTDTYTNADTELYSNADTSCVIGKKRKRTRRGRSSGEAKAQKGKKWRARKKARKLGLDVKEVYEEKGIKVRSDAPPANSNAIAEETPEPGPSIPLARHRSLALGPAPSMASIASIALDAPTGKKAHRGPRKRNRPSRQKRIEKWRRKADIAARFDKALMEMRKAHQALVDQVLAEEAKAERLEPQEGPEPEWPKQEPRRTHTVSDNEDHDDGAMSDWSISSSVNTVKTI